MSNPDPTPVLDLLEGFRRSKTMFAACEFGIFDRLAAGPADAAALSSGADPDAMRRLLDACVSLGLLVRDGGRYANSPVADMYLRSDSPNTMAGYIDYSNRVLYHLWSNLEDALREGTHRWKQTFGFDGGIFSHFYNTPERRRAFLLGMHGMGMLSSPAVVQAFDLSQFHRLVDLGGGTGHLAMAACDRYPNLQAAVFDLPAAIEEARTFTAGSRVELLPGDFFADHLPQADLYAVGRILHDWGDEKVRRLLTRIYEALPPGGALLIAERLLAEDRSGPTATHMQSLNMLVCTEGKERTLSEYTALLRQAGFASVEGKRTGTVLDATLAYK